MGPLVGVHGLPASCPSHRAVNAGFLRSFATFLPRRISASAPLIMAFCTLYTPVHVTKMPRLACWGQPCPL
jgi:hypothetical protein